MTGTDAGTDTGTSDTFARAEADARIEGGAQAKPGALVLFSGGQDSATCLAWALERYGHVETLGFDYGQRHRVELDCRGRFRDALHGLFPTWGARLGDDHVLDLSVLGGMSETAMTREIEIEARTNGLPNTFVPGRNLMFLTFAAALAYRRGLKMLIGGMCETDFSGYPDCRDDTLKALQVALNLGMDRRFVVETPLMWLDKAATWQLAQTLGGDALVELVRVETHTCYLGGRTELHAWGFGCGTCPACQLRMRGYARFRHATRARFTATTSGGTGQEGGRMSYAVKEIFYTLQGEGANAGRPAVFCRFAGCNLWSGREADRAAAVCQFCDTDFVGTDGELGGKYRAAAELAALVASLWPAGEGRRFVVCTGGEPLLQLDAVLIDALHAHDFEIAIETNGSLPVPPGIDWVCVSPKMGAPLVVTRGNELKVVMPQADQPFDTYQQLDFEHFLVQPMDGPSRDINTRLAIDWCKRHPRWRLSMQTHKYLMIP